MLPPLRVKRPPIGLLLSGPVSLFVFREAVGRRVV